MVRKLSGQWSDLGESTLMAFHGNGPDCIVDRETLCDTAAALLHVDVTVWNQVPIEAQQVDGSIAGPGLLTAGAGMIHDSRLCKVPVGERRCENQKTLQSREPAGE